LYTLTAVRVAEIAPWIHYSWVKPASLEWEHIPDLASPCKFTLQNVSTLPWQDSAPQETIGSHRWWTRTMLLSHGCSCHLGSWLVYVWQKLEKSTIQWDKWTVFCQLFYCNALSPLVCVCCCSSHPSLHHRFGGDCPYRLDSQQKVFISSFLPLLSRMHDYCSLLLIWFPFVIPEPSSCDLWVHTTWAGSVVTRTLLFHIYYSCAGSVIRSCTHNHTTYLMCSHGNQHICFNPTYRLWEQRLEIQSICNPGNLFSYTQVFSPDKPVSMFFDACVAIDHSRSGGVGCGCRGLAWERDYTSNDKYMYHRDNAWPCDNVGSYYCPYWSCVSWATRKRAKYTAFLHKRIAAPNCTPGNCNPVNFDHLIGHREVWLV
jgi:hypothetical protein